jgi:hypothetical protein
MPGLAMAFGMASAGDMWKVDATWRPENLDCILKPQAYLH